jgi:hypothetical protein
MIDFRQKYEEKEKEFNELKTEFEEFQGTIFKISHLLNVDTSKEIEDEFELSKKELEENVQILTKNYNQIQKDYALLKVKIFVSNYSKEKYKKECLEIEKENDKLKNTVQSLQKEHNRVKKRLVDLEIENEDLLRSVKMTDSLNNDLERKVDSAVEEIAIIQSQFEYTKEQMHGMRELMNEKNQEIIIKERELAMANTKLMQLEAFIENPANLSKENQTASSLITEPEMAQSSELDEETMTELKERLKMNSNNNSKLTSSIKSGHSEELGGSPMESPIRMNESKTSEMNLTGENLLTQLEQANCSSSESQASNPQLWDFNSKINSLKCTPRDNILIQEDNLPPDPKSEIGSHTEKSDTNREFESSPLAGILNKKNTEDFERIKRKSVRIKPPFIEQLNLHRRKTDSFRSKFNVASKIGKSNFGENIEKKVSLRKVSSCSKGKTKTAKNNLLIKINSLEMNDILELKGKKSTLSALELVDNLLRDINLKISTLKTPKKKTFDKSFGQILVQN